MIAFIDLISVACAFNSRFIDPKGNKVQINCDGEDELEWNEFQISVFD